MEIAKISGIKKIRPNSIDQTMGIIIGSLCTINGFMFHIGGFNMRICDIFFYVAVIYGVSNIKRQQHYFKVSIIRGLLSIVILTIWTFLSGMIHYEDFSVSYQEFFLKYSINKTLWIPIYAMLFMMYGGKPFLQGVFIGISTCAIFNSLLVIYEYLKIQSGYLPKYEFLKIIGIYYDSKKDDVINQNMIRPTGLMLDPNYTGGYTGIGVIYFDYLYSLHRKRIYALLSVISIIPMFLLFSRTGLFSICTCFIISIILRIVYGKANIKLIAPYVIFFIIIFAIVALIYIFSFDEKAATMLVDRLSMNDSSSSVRSDYLKYFFNLADVADILFGVGSAGHFLTRFWNMTEVWAPESSYISLLIDNGIIFLIIYILFEVRIFFKLLHTNYYFAILLLYINLISLSYNFLGDRVYYFLSACLFLCAFTTNIGEYGKNSN